MTYPRWLGYIGVMTNATELSRSILEWLLSMGSATAPQADTAMAITLAAVLVVLAVTLAIALIHAVLGPIIRWAFHWGMAVVGVGLVAWGLVVVTGAWAAGGGVQ